MSKVKLLKEIYFYGKSKKKYFMALLMMLICVGVVSAGGPLNNSLRAYYSFDSDCLTDDWASYNGNATGVANGATGAKNGSACQFDGGAADVIKLPTTLVGGLSKGTISMWTNHTSLTGDQHYWALTGAVARSTWVANAAYKCGNFQITATTTLYCFDSAYTVNEYRHYVFTWNSSGKYIYQNGVLKNSTASVAAFDNKILYLGQNGANTNDDMIGWIDEVGIWNRSITDAEVSSLYNGGDGCFLGCLNESAAAPAPENYTWSAPPVIGGVYYQENATSTNVYDYLKSNGTTTTLGNISNYAYVNYTKPYGANMAYWQVKHGNSTSPQTYNISMRDRGCWDDNSDNVQLRMFSNISVSGKVGYANIYGSSWFECYNSSGSWVFIGQNLSNSNTTLKSYNYEVVGTTYPSCISSVFDGDYSTKCEAGVPAGIDQNIWRSVFYATTTTNVTEAAWIYEEGVWWNVTINNVTFLYLDEADNSSLYGTNVTVYANSPENFWSNTNAVGNYSHEFGRHNYTITFSADGYGQKIRYFYYPTTIIDYMTTYSYNDMIYQELYFLNLGSSTDVLATVYQNIGQKLTGVVISAQKWNLGTNTYTEVEDCITDSNGQCLLHLELLNTTYSFVITNQGNIIFTSLDQKIYTNTISFTLSTIGDLLTTTKNKFTADGVLTYDDASTNVSYSYVDNLAAISSGCLGVKAYDAARLKVDAVTCSDNTTGTIVYAINMSSYDSVVVTGWVVDTNGVPLVLDTISQANKSLATDSGLNGLFIFGFIIVGALFFVGLWSPVAAIVFGVAALGGAAFLGFINITTPTIMLLGTIAIIVAWRLKA